MWPASIGEPTPAYSDDERTNTMAINPPVDATKTPEWAALQKHYDELQAEGVSLKQWFADDAERVDKLSFDAGDLHFDLSKNLIKPETLQLFADLAKAVKLDERTKWMYPPTSTMTCWSTSMSKW